MNWVRLSFTTYPYLFSALVVKWVCALTLYYFIRHCCGLKHYLDHMKSVLRKHQVFSLVHGQVENHKYNHRHKISLSICFSFLGETIHFGYYAETPILNRYRLTIWTRALVVFEIFANYKNPLMWTNERDKCLRYCYVLYDVVFILW